MEGGSISHAHIEVGLWQVDCFAYLLLIYASVPVVHVMILIHTLRVCGRASLHFNTIRSRRYHWLAVRYVRLGSWLRMMDMMMV